MKYKDALKLRYGDEVLNKKTGLAIVVSFIERYEKDKTVYVFCDDGNEYHHREVKRSMAGRKEKAMSNREDIRCKVYNALANIMYETESSREDMDYALRWFSQKFWEDCEEDSE